MEGEQVVQRCREGNQAEGIAGAKAQRWDRPGVFWRSPRWPECNQQEEESWERKMGRWTEASVGF